MDIEKKSSLSAHRNKCEDMFKEIKSGKVIYARIDDYIGPEIEKEKGYIRVSILTDRIIEYDIEMQNIDDPQRLLEVYRPYFASFVIELDETNIKNLQELDGEWRVCQYVADGENIEGDKGAIVFYGYLELSASPISYLNGKLLCFKNTVIPTGTINRIRATYNPQICTPKSSNKIEQTINKAWMNANPEKIDIYNIGHGNADYIRGDKKSLLYDIGYNYRQYPSYKKARFLRAVNAIRQLRPSCVILSHWDMDHIIGCAYADQRLFSVKWIAPALFNANYKKQLVSTNAVRLAKYLNKLHNLYLVDRNTQNKLIARIKCNNGMEMQLWLGDGNSRAITKRNSEGLFIEILKGEEEHLVLLAGDVPYGAMQNISITPYEFLHVPHHCSKMELINLRRMNGKGKLGVISTNRNRRNPARLNYNDQHFNELLRKFTDVITTIDNPMHNDERNLSIQIDLDKRTWRIR